MEAHGHEEFWSGAADRREEAAATAAPPRRALPGREDVLLRVAPAEREVSLTKPCLMFGSLT